MVLCAVAGARYTYLCRVLSPPACVPAPVAAFGGYLFAAHGGGIVSR